MNAADYIKWCVASLAVMALLSCGEVKEAKNLTLSGFVTFKACDPDDLGPVFVAVLDKNPLENKDKDMADLLVAIHSIDKEDLTFNVNVSDTLLSPGDTIYIVAFADNDFLNGVPNVTVGDTIGFYLDSHDMTNAYMLKAGANSGIGIEVARTIVDFEAVVSGEILGTEEGAITVLAYAGEINSFDFSDLDVNGIIGISQFIKGSEPHTYSLDIFPYLPFGYGVPVDNVYLIAFLDKNQNGQTDGGDRIGFYQGNNTDETGVPQLITLSDNDALGEKDISLYGSIAEPSGDTIKMSGTVDVAPDFDVMGKPVFILVLEAGDVLSLLSGSFLDKLVYFYKIPANENEIADEEKRSFSFDLSTSGLAAGDDVMLIAVVDNDYTAGFPDPQNGDYLGIYLNKQNLSVNYTLAQPTLQADGTDQSINDNINIPLNMTYIDFSLIF